MSNITMITNKITDKSMKMNTNYILMIMNKITMNIATETTTKITTRMAHTENTNKIMSQTTDSTNRIMTKITDKITKTIMNKITNNPKKTAKFPKETILKRTTLQWADHTIKQGVAIIALVEVSTINDPLKTTIVQILLTGFHTFS